MRSVQGLLLIGVALFLLWIGITGRFDKLIEALGVIRSAQPSTLGMPGATIYPSPIGPGLP